MSPTEVDGPAEGEILVVGWGGTLGSITAAVESVRAEGISVSRLQLRHLNPLPNDLGDILKRFEKVLLPELSDGNLAMLLRAKYLVDVRSLAKVEGQPFKISELTEAIHELHSSPA